MQRISVIGVTGSGKTTFAAALAGRLGVPHVELDALHWEPNWTMADLDVFRRRVASAIQGDRWVVDGNYSKVRDIVWGRADSVVWLDFPFPLTFVRLVRRTIARVRTGEELWNGNRERLAEQFLSRESLFWWAIKTYPRYRVSIPAALASEPYRHLRVARFRRPRAARRWLDNLELSPGLGGQPPMTIMPTASIGGDSANDGLALRAKSAITKAKRAICRKV